MDEQRNDYRIDYMNIENVYMDMRKDERDVHQETL